MSSPLDANGVAMLCPMCSSPILPAPSHTAVEPVGELRKKWTRADSLRLYAGEMTAQELRTAKAIAEAVINDAISTLTAQAAALVAAETGLEWVMVPREPTEAMIVAGHKQIDWCRNDQNTHRPGHPSQKPDGVGSDCGEDVADAWRAMLAASPPLPAGEYARGIEDATPTLKQAATAAIAAVDLLDDLANENETAWTGWGWQIVPAEATWWRVKAGQARMALAEFRSLAKAGEATE